MKIIVDHTSMQPIYEQIVEQIKKQILQGTLREGAPLDSVRMLAKDLKVSALTVKKAYDALEEEQLIATVHGKGSFVLGVNPSLLAEEQKREIEQRMEQLVAKARAYGMSDEELEAMGAGALRKAVKEGDSENGCFMAGESCALVTKIQPAAEIIRDVVTEGEALLKGAMQWVK